MQSRDRGNSEGVWEHDKFVDEDEEEEVVEYEAPARSAGGALETGAKLQISNLAFNVSDDDIKELFESLGDLKKAFVQYDKSGRSLGTATVIYTRRSAAQEALKKYNGVTLDGQAMKITMVSSGPAGGAKPRALRTSADGGARSFRKAVSDAGRLTVSVASGRSSGGRRVVVGRRGGAASGGRGVRGGRGGRGRGGRVAGRQVYVRY